MRGPATTQVSQRMAVVFMLAMALTARLLAANDKTTINLSNKSGAVGETITLEASLLSVPPSPNANVLGREIKFLVDGKEACAGKVATLNLASCKWKVPTLTQGTRPLEARFAGDGTWAASKASAQIVIAKAPTTLHIGKSEGGYDQKVVPGGSLQFEVYLKRTTDKEAIEGRVVSFTVDGQPAGKGRTGYGGSAYLEYSVPPHFPGDVNVEAFFEGDDSYVASSAKHSFPAPPKPGATILSLKCGGGLTVEVHVLIESLSGICAFTSGLRLADTDSSTSRSRLHFPRASIGP